MNKDFLFTAKSYIDFVEFCLSNGTKTRIRGSIQALANALKCHPTFISQVLQEKSHFSIEQALEFCAFYDLSQDEVEYFIILVQLARAGSRLAIKFYKTQQQVFLQKREILAERKKITTCITLDEFHPFLVNWIPQALNLLLQIPSYSTNVKIAAHLGLNTETVEKYLKLMEENGFVRHTKSGWCVTKESMHLGLHSNAATKIHTN